MSRLKDRYSAVMEVLIALGLMTALMPVKMLTGINPQPFFIVVLYGALTAGTWVGVFAGILSSLLFMILSIYTTGFSISVLKEFIAATPTLYVTPFIYLIVGYVAGEARLSWQRRIQRLNERTELLQQEAGHRSVQLRQAEEAILELQGRVLGQTATMARLYQIAQNLNVLSIEKILTELMGVLEDLLQVEQASIYRIEENGRFARLVLRKGESVWPNSVALEQNAIWQEAVSRGEVLTLFDFVQRPAPVYMVPIHFSRRVYAMIAVHRLPKVKVNPDSRKLLSVLADWAGESLQRASKYETTRLQDARFSGTIVLRPEFFKEQCALERDRFERYGIPFTILEATVDTRLRSDEVPEHLTKALQGRIRTWDLVAWEAASQKVSLLMPGLDDQFAGNVRARIWRSLHDSNLQILSDCVLSNDIYRDVREAAVHAK